MAADALDGKRCNLRSCAAPGPACRISGSQSLSQSMKQWQVATSLERLSAQQIASWARAEHCRESLIALAAELAPHGVEMLVMKGLFIAFATADAPWLRPMADADALVVGGSLGRAADVVRSSARFRLVFDNTSTKVFQDRQNKVLLDLHRWPLPPRFGRLSTKSLRARAHQSPEIFGPHLLVPEATDAAVIAVANYVKDCFGSTGPQRLADDLGWLRECADVQPERLAARMSDYRLRRVGIAAFAALTDESAKWREWLEAFRPARSERRGLKLTAQAVRRLANRHPSISHAMVRSIGDNAADSAIGLGLTLARLARDAVRDLVRRVENVDATKP